MRKLLSFISFFFPSVFIILVFIRFLVYFSFLHTQLFSLIQSRVYSVTVSLSMLLTFCLYNLFSKDIKIKNKLLKKTKLNSPKKKDINNAYTFLYLTIFISNSLLLRWNLKILIIDVCHQEDCLIETSILLHSFTCCRPTEIDCLTELPAHQLLSSQLFISWEDIHSIFSSCFTLIEC